MADSEKDILDKLSRWPDWKKQMLNDAFNNTKIVPLKKRTSSKEIQSCPSCSSDAKIMWSILFDEVCVECVVCHRHSRMCKNEQAAIDTWNDRSGEDEAPKFNRIPRRTSY